MNRDSPLLSRLREVLECYPRNQKGSSNKSTLELKSGGAELEINFKFDDSLEDTIDRLIVEFVAGRVERKGIPNLSSTPLTCTYSCNEKQANEMMRYLAYASTLLLAKKPSKVTEQQQPLSLLLTYVLHLFKETYSHQASSKETPSIELLSNVLRPLGKKPIDYESMIQSSVCTNRTLATVLRATERLKITESDKAFSPQRKRPIRLTKLGSKLKKTGLNALESTESAWKSQFGKDYSRLRDNLSTIVNKIDLALPYFITGYGAADEALTGGNYLAEEIGPPYIPARGQEWPVVLRNEQVGMDFQPTSMLLSQAFTQFVIDYERKNLGRLGLTALFFQYLPDEGMSLKEAREYQPITGDGKSLHERHLNIVLSPGKPRDGSRMVYPTPKAQLSRDSYSVNLANTESEWSKTLGDEIIEQLRESLATIAADVDETVPHYPNTTSWMLPYSSNYMIEGSS